MAQTKAGAKKAAQTIKDRYGLTADGRSKQHVEAGAIGGKNGRTGGFYANRELARIAGAKGGRISRRTPKSYKVGESEYLT